MNTALQNAPDVLSMRRISALLLLAAAAVALGAVALWGVRQPVFDVTRIVVEGDVAHSSEQELRRQLARITNGNVLTLDLHQARVAFEQLPWVRRAQVRRVFPNRLHVTLQEHQAQAWWRAEGELLNSFGEVFDAVWPGASDAALQHAHLPQLWGPDGSAAHVLHMYYLLQPTLQTLGQVQTLRLRERGTWQAQLAGGTALELGAGTPEAVLPRVQRFVRTVGQVRQGLAVQSADLRYAGGYALKLARATAQ